jgi:hypothetical protein
LGKRIHDPDYNFSALRTAVILYCCPGARLIAASRMLLASTQTNCFHSPSPRSRNPAASSCHGFHTTVVRELAFVSRMRRRISASDRSIVPLVSRYALSVCEAITTQPGRLSPCLPFPLIHYSEIYWKTGFGVPNGKLRELLKPRTLYRRRLIPWNVLRSMASSYRNSSSPCSPIPIPRASFCGTCRSIGIPSCSHRIADTPD